MFVYLYVYIYIYICSFIHSLIHYCSPTLSQTLVVRRDFRKANRKRANELSKGFANVSRIELNRRVESDRQIVVFNPHKFFLLTQN